jgi:DNA repair exonuclease SbcCD ATPase subunit
MQLIKIKLENFTCFLDSIELNFGNGLNIVNAGNGYGKSKFLDSINWVISNKIFQGNNWIDSEKVDLYPLWYTNPNNVEEYKKDEVITSVELIFSAPDIDNDIENNTTWTFNKQRFHRRSLDGSLSFIRDELKIKYIDLETGEHNILGRHREYDVIETLFPLAIRTFMWFQGEAFKDISLSHNSENFNKVLDTISHYPIYGKMVERASIALNKKDRQITKLRREQQGVSREQAEKLYRKDTLLNKIPELKKQIEDINEDIQSHENQIAEYGDYLKKSHEYVKLDAELKSKDKSIKYINDSIEQYEISKANLLIKKWVIAGSKNQIEKFQETVDLVQEELNQIDEAKIPLHIPGPEMVQGMIDEMKCHICEREIPNEEDESYKALLRRLEIFKEGKKAKWLRKNFDSFKRMKKYALESYNEIESGIKNHKKNIQSKIRDRNKLQGEKTELNSQLKELNNGKNSNSSGSNYDLFFNKKQQKESSLRNLRLRLGSLDKNLKNYKEELIILSEEIKSNETDSSEINQGETSLKYYKVLLGVLKDLEDDAKSQLEKEITLKSNNLFKVYYDNPGLDIKIESGSVKLFDLVTKEEIDIVTLNKSQQEMIKFSVINSLLKLSNEKLGNSLPLIADAPTSSSEWTNTKYFTDNVGNNFEQVVLFSKDYIEQCSDESVKTSLINLCKKSGGAWYWCQKVDKKGKPVGRQFDNPKSDSESKTIITEAILA